jgi:hypothetical protein
MIINVDITTPKRVDKKWGYELWIHNDSEYCGKLLVFTKERNRFSMHYHLQKKKVGMCKKVDSNLIGLM